MYKITLLAIIPLALCRAQAPAADPQHASIEGQVVSITGEPLKKVTLRLQPVASAAAALANLGAGASRQPGPMTAPSDSEGNFVFRNVDPGRYTLSAERAGFVRAAYAPAGGGTTLLTLTAGQSLTGIAFKMTPESAISGKVYDADGDPFPKARVTVSRVQYSTRGKQLLLAGSATASLDGSFRIEGLTAGRYYISAEDPQLSSRIAALLGTNTQSKAPEEGYVPTYFPSAMQVSDATAAVVTAGVESRGMDIRMVQTRVFHIRGKVLDVTTGAAPATGMVRITPKESLELISRFQVSSTIRNGTFDFGGLAAGDYILESSPITSRAADGTMTSSSLVGRQSITVGNSDVNDVTFRIGPGAEITGKVSTEPGAAQQPQKAGQAPATPPPPMIILSPVQGVTGSSNVTSKGDGTFAIHGVPPGVYQVQVLFNAPGTYLKSVRYGNQDITTSVLDLTSGTGAALDVLFSPNAADLRGSLHGSGGAPLPNIYVTAWMAGAAQSGGISAINAGRTDASGSFTISGLAPGDYRVAAWDLTDQALMQAPEFRAKFEGKAAKVKLSENSHETVEPPLIPRDVTDAAVAELR